MKWFSSYSFSAYHTNIIYAIHRNIPQPISRKIIKNFAFLPFYMYICSKISKNGKR